MEKKENKKEAEGKKKAEDKKKGSDFKDKIIAKLGDELGISALNTNGGLMHQGKWEKSNQIVIPEGISNLAEKLKYFSGKCKSEHLYKNLSI
jgi:hypothetical protein